MKGKFLYAFAQIDQAEVAGTDVAAIGGNDEFAAASEHVYAHVVHEGTGHISGTAHSDIVSGIGAGAAGAVRARKVVPAVIIEHYCGFAVDGNITGLVVRVNTFSRFGIQLDLADVAEEGSVHEIQAASDGIEEESRIDGIAVFDAVGRSDAVLS
jgi:hypothetical protein